MYARLQTFGGEGTGSVSSGRGARSRGQRKALAGQRRCRSCRNGLAVLRFPEGNDRSRRLPVRTESRAML